MLYRRLSLLTLLTTFLLLLLGGVVHNTGSSLACPDWPLCYGQFFPKMEGGILIEHGHRLLASFVGLLTLIMAAMAFRLRKKSEKHSHFSKLTLLALFFVILQGLLGGITVIYRLPTIVSTSHLALSMIFFCTLILIFHEARFLVEKSENPLELEDIPALQKGWSTGTKNALQISSFLIYIQIILGAFMRHSGAGVSCGLGWDNAFLCLDTNTWIKSFWPAMPIAQLHMLHRYIGVGLGIIVLLSLLRAIIFSITRKNLIGSSVFKNIIFHGTFGIIVIFAQVCLGFFTVAYNLSPMPTTLHLGGAALILGTLWSLSLFIGRLESEVFPNKIYSTLEDLVELTKPKLSGLVVATIFIGMFIAPGEIGFFKGAFAIISCLLVVYGAAVLNCYLERDVDLLMDRTKNRALPAGRIDPGMALFFGCFLLCVSLPILAIFINPLTCLLACLATILYLFFYTPMKQKTELAVIVGAIPGAIPPVMGWTAVTGHIDPMAWILFLVLFIWQLPHFLAISIYHAEDYGKASIKVFPNLKGLNMTRSLIFWFTFLMLGISILPFFYGFAGPAYAKAAFVMGGIFTLIAAVGFIYPVKGAAQRSWARIYFLGSIFYLPLLLGAMAFLK